MNFGGIYGAKINISIIILKKYLVERNDFGFD